MAVLKSTVPVVFKFDVAVTFTAVAAASCVDFTFATALGLRPGWHTACWIEGLTANVGIVNAYCSAKDTLLIRIVNPTAGSINPGAQTIRIIQR